MARSLIFALFVCFSVVLADNARLVVPDEAIEGQYIVVFKSGTSLDDRDSHVAALESKFGADEKILFRYEVGEFIGFAAKIGQTLLEQQLASPLVDFIETDSWRHSTQTCNQQSGATWGINRVSEKALNLNGKYKYSQNGAGVDAYIIDTGILISHVDFEGRAVWGYNAVDTQNTDCNGHGTHVSGTVGGKTWGIAKKVSLIAVKVLDCQGSGTNAGVIAGVQWAQNQYVNKGKPGVANMSLGGSKSTALDNAVKAAINAGLFFAVASGNENQDACNTSPGGLTVAVSVGATGTDSVSDNRAAFSNWGTCVSILAPGELITSTWIGSSNTATKTISGTSMASPHVCGAAALYLAEETGATPADTKKFLVASASSNLVDLECTGNCAKTPNKLLHHGCAAPVLPVNNSL